MVRIPTLLAVLMLAVASGSRGDAAPRLGCEAFAGRLNARLALMGGSTMKEVPCFGRWAHSFDPALRAERVEFTGSDGSRQVRPTFAHQPAELHYDHRGYEAVVAKGSPVTVVRFTPTRPGTYRYRALRGDTAVEEGQFTCTPSRHPGYVERSKRDPRYFAFTDGSSYCPIGLNLIGPPFYALPRGGEHFLTSGKNATLGCLDYSRWFRELSRNGGNFTRLWLTNNYFNVDTETAGEVNLLPFTRLDAVVELAREHGIRLKLCLEHFRVVEQGKSWAYKSLKHPEDGRAPAGMAEWFQSPAWQDLWWKKMDAYLARYGDDPTVMAWELWNEINCCDTGDWAIQRDWTQRTLRAIKERSPRNLVTNSLGSFDAEGAQAKQNDFHMEEMEFQQVHRYLDQGAPLPICHTDPVAFSVDAIQRSRRPDRPILLAETGGVNDNHTGPFRFYRWDDRGVIFHDTTFPAFFAGAAGTGQIWHWNEYVDQKGLWSAFRPFANLIEGIALDAEGFQPLDLSTDDAWFLALNGKNHVLALVRNKSDRWDRVLREGEEPPILRDQTIDLKALKIPRGKVTVIYPWHEWSGAATLQGGRLHLPNFRYGLMVRIDKQD